MHTKPIQYNCISEFNAKEQTWNFIGSAVFYYKDAIHFNSFPLSAVSHTKKEMELIWSEEDGLTLSPNLRLGNILLQGIHAEDCSGSNAWRGQCKLPRSTTDRLIIQ